MSFVCNESTHRHPVGIVIPAVLSGSQNERCEHGAKAAFCQRCIEQYGSHVRDACPHGRAMHRCIICFDSKAVSSFAYVFCQHRKRKHECDVCHPCIHKKASTACGTCNGSRNLFRAHQAFIVSGLKKCGDIIDRVAYSDQHYSPDIVAAILEQPQEYGIAAHFSAVDEFLGISPLELACRFTTDLENIGRTWHEFGGRATDSLTLDHVINGVVTGYDLRAHHWSNLRLATFSENCSRNRRR